MCTLCTIILTKNEEKDIEGAIQSAWQCSDEVLVVDSGSTDRTVELAKFNDARVVYRAWDNDFAAQRNFALTQTDAKWVLYLDADERMDLQLTDEINKIVASSAPADLQESSGAPVASPANKTGLKWVTRLFPRQSVTWVGKVHEHPECSLPLEKLPGHIEHYTYRNWQEWEEKMSRYSTLWAEEAYHKGRRASLPEALLHGIGSLFSTLLLRLGFLDGWMGICLCCMYFSYTMLKYLKLYGLQQRDIAAEGYRVMIQPDSDGGLNVE